MLSYACRNEGVGKSAGRRWSKQFVTKVFISYKTVANKDFCGQNVLQ